MERERILIVDDDVEVRESLADELGDDYDVSIACSGEEAVQLLETERFDAVISDLRMPGIGGLEVLDRVHEVDPEAVRILLTGFADGEATRRTLQPDAPFKIGKPWHDELEVTLRRAFEQRVTRKCLSSSVVDALAVAGVDDELSRATGLTAIAQTLTRRAMEVHGVEAAGVELELCGRRRPLAGTAELECYDASSPHAWFMDEPITADGATRLRVVGEGDTTLQIVRFLVERTRKWTSDDAATQLARKAAADPDARNRLSAVSRRAALGTMTASLVHELASVVQSLQGSLYELDYIGRDMLAKEPEAIECLDTANETALRMMKLFKAMRTFVRSGQQRHKPCKADELVAKAVALCSGYARGRAPIRLGAIADCTVEVNEPLFLQVLVNLLRNAADASDNSGHIDVEAELDGAFVRFYVTDDGPGVSAEEQPTLFEPFVTTKGDNLGSGLGLAISAEIARDHHGRIDYQDSPGRGARFVVTVPTYHDTGEPKDE